MMGELEHMVTVQGFQLLSLGVGNEVQSAWDAWKKPNTVTNYPNSDLWK